MTGRQRSGSSPEPDPVQQRPQQRGRRQLLVPASTAVLQQRGGRAALGDQSRHDPGTGQSRAVPPAGRGGLDRRLGGEGAVLEIGDAQHRDQTVDGVPDGSLSAGEPRSGRRSRPPPTAAGRWSSARSRPAAGPRSARPGVLVSPPPGWPCARRRRPRPLSPGAGSRTAGGRCARPVRAGRGRDRCGPASARPQTEIPPGQGRWPSARNASASPRRSSAARVPGVRVSPKRSVGAVRASATTTARRVVVRQLDRGGRPRRSATDHQHVAAAGDRPTGRTGGLSRRDRWGWHGTATRPPRSPTAPRSAAGSRPPGRSPAGTCRRGSPSPAG